MQFEVMSSNDIAYLNAFVISNFINEPIHIIDSKGNMVFANKSWYDLYDTTPDMAIGKHIQDNIESSLNYYMDVKDIDSLSSVDMAKLSYTHLDERCSKSTALRVLDEKKKISMVTDHYLNGHRVLVTSNPIFNDNQELVYVFTFVQDLSRLSEWHRQLDEERKKNQLIHAELEYLRQTQLNSPLTGHSKTLDSIKKMVTTVAKTDASILITGESGVGKEVVAKEIFSNSLRKDKPYITVNCAAIPETLLESELFGYEQGAFTGATKRKIGLFELANGGTLLLDEIGELPLKLQPKLLRVLQEKEISRIGGQVKISIDVRIIAATNQNLFQMTQTGQFRSDLYYRLNVIPIEIAPLRERKEDIIPLALVFWEKFKKKYNSEKTLSATALYTIENHDWPGNIRELENAIERMVIIGDSEVITEQHVLLFIGRLVDSDEDDPEAEELSLQEAVKCFEKKLVQKALEKHGTTYKAAKALKTSQPTIVRKAQAMGITKW